jgi:hypothetical protein
MKEAHSTVLLSWMMRRRRIRKGRENGSLIPTLAVMVVLVDRADVEKALSVLRLTAVT